MSARIGAYNVELALSIRQPWPWLIIHAGKDVENRTWKSRVRGRVLIHASKTMTRREYDECQMFCSTLQDYDGTWVLPPYESLLAQCGGIVGVMNIKDCVERSDSPWFCGPWGFVIDSAAEMKFEPCKGGLGFFRPNRG